MMAIRLMMAGRFVGSALRAHSTSSCVAPAALDVDGTQWRSTACWAANSRQPCMNGSGAIPIGRMNGIPRRRQEFELELAARVRAARFGDNSFASSSGRWPIGARPPAPQMIPARRTASAEFAPAAAGRAARSASGPSGGLTGSAGERVRGPAGVNW
jgi:hypothetical protein